MRGRALGRMSSPAPRSHCLDHCGVPHGAPYHRLVPPLLASMGGFGDFSRALLQGLADNSHISDLQLDLSNCEVRGQHPRVPSFQPGGPIAAVKGACSLCGKVRARSAAGLG